MTQMAAILGKSVRMLANYRDEGAPIPAGSRGVSLEFESSEVIEWLIAREVAKVRGSASEGDIPAKERLDLAKAQIAEIDLAERRGEVVNADQALREFAKLAADARQRFIGLSGSLPSRLAALTDPNEVQAELGAAIRACLEELHGTYEVFDGGSEGLCPGDEAAAET